MATRLRLLFRRRDKVVVFQGADGRWYWQRRSRNGRVISDGGEGYSRRDSARRGAIRNNRNLTVVYE